MPSPALVPRGATIEKSRANETLQVARDLGFLAGVQKK